MVMTDNITPIRPHTSTSPIKQQFLDYVAQKFDELVERGQSEPRIIVFNLVDFEGNASCNYLCLPDGVDNSLYLARAFHTLQVEMIEWGK